MPSETADNDNHQTQKNQNPAATDACQRPKAMAVRSDHPIMAIIQI
jgi:hypothetical protein